MVSFHPYISYLHSAVTTGNRQVISSSFPLYVCNDKTNIRNKINEKQGKSEASYHVDILLNVLCYRYLFLFAVKDCLSFVFAFSQHVDNVVSPLIYNLSQGTIKKKDWRRLPAALVPFHLTET